MRHRRDRPCVLFIGASISQLAAIRQARANGWRVVAVDGDPGAVAFADADVAVPIDFSDVEEVVAVGLRNDVDAVVAISSDRAVPIAAAVAERLGLPGIGIDTAHRMTDKVAMRERLREVGVRQPPFLEISTGQVHAEEAEAVGYPAVLKPADSGGQRGVFEIRNHSELLERLPETLRYSRSHRAIFERFVDGTELNGIVVVRGGHPTVLTLSDRLRPPGVGFGVGWIHLYPSQVPPDHLAAACELAGAAVAALGLRDGIAFPQLIVDGDGVAHAIEIAARIPAGQMADLVRLAIGVDLVDIALAQAHGSIVRDDMIARRFDRPIAIRFLTASPGFLPVGRLTGVDGLDRVRAAPGVLQADLYLRMGESIRPVQVDEDRRGYIITTAADAATALELAQEAARELTVHVQPEPTALAN